MKIEMWDIDRPKDYPKNPRKWTPQAIAKSVEHQDFRMATARCGGQERCNHYRPSSPRGG